MTLWLVACTAWILAIAGIDVFSRRLGNAWLVAGIALAVAGWLLSGAQPVALIGRALAAGLGFAVMWPGWQLAMIGGADVKAMAVVGAMTGAVGVIEVALAGSAVFGLMCVVALARGRGPQARLPYLPALAVAVVAWLWTGPWWLGLART